MTAHRRYRLLPIYCLIFIMLNKSAATAQSASVSAAFNDTLLCVGQNFTVPITSTGNFDDTNVFAVEISGPTGSFATPVVIGYGYGAGVGITNANCVLNTAIVPGTGYRIRINANHPSYISAPNPDNIRISPYPTVSVSHLSTVCFGSTINLSVSTPNPNPTFDWTGPGAWSASGNTASRSNASYADSGTYYIKVTSYKCSSTDSTKILVLPKPVFSGWDTDSSSCEGEPFNIKPLCNVCNLPSNQVSYLWKYPPAGASGQSYINLLASNLNNTGWFKVTVKIGDCQTTDSFRTVIKPKPDGTGGPSASSNGPLCEGENLLLYGSSTSSAPAYRWEGPAGFQSTLQNPFINGITKANEGDYYLYTTYDGCESIPGKTTVKVGIPLTPLNITGDTTLCPGDQLRLSAQTSISTGIVWNKMPHDSIIISTARTFGKLSTTASDAGLYRVTQEVQGCKSPPSFINVIIPDIRIPEPVNNGPLCPGETLHWEITQSQGGTYLWSGPDGFSSTSPTPTIENVDTKNAGKYVITATLDYCTVTDSNSLEVKPEPEITYIGSNSPVCTDTKLTLHAESSLPSSVFEWSGPSGFTSDMQSPEIILTKTLEGKYTVKANADGCYSEPATTIVVAREGPGTGKATNNSPIDEGETLELHANNTKDSVSFYWEGPDGFTSTEQNPTIPVATARNNGAYNLMSIYNGCTTITKTQVQVKDILGITVQLYPNPNDGIFTITGIGQTNETIRLNIYNHQGKIVHADEVIPDKYRFTKTIDLKGAASGVYILRLVAGAEKRNIRFTIVRQ